MSSKSPLKKALDKFNFKRRNCVGCSNSCDFCKKHYKVWTRIMKTFGDEFD